MDFIFSVVSMFWAIRCSDHLVWRRCYYCVEDVVFIVRKLFYCVPCDYQLSGVCIVCFHCCGSRQSHNFIFSVSYQSSAMVVRQEVSWKLEVCSVDCDTKESLDRRWWKVRSDVIRALRSRSLI